MDCLVAQEEPEGRPGGPGDVKTAREDLLALLPLHGPLGLPSGSSFGSLATHSAILILKPALKTA